MGPLIKEITERGGRLIIGDEREDHHLQRMGARALIVGAIAVLFNQVIQPTLAEGRQQRVATRQQRAASSPSQT